MDSGFFGCGLRWFERERVAVGTGIPIIKPYEYYFKILLVEMSWLI
jgi:hypothetical protein